jgi:hypothetical protein
MSTKTRKRTEKAYIPFNETDTFGYVLGYIHMFKEGLAERGDLGELVEVRINLAEREMSLIVELPNGSRSEVPMGFSDEVETV